MVEPDRNNNPSLQQYVKDYLKKSLSSATEVYAQHIHRIDRPVSGVVLFAKQRAVLKNLSEQFAERKVKKFYKALTATAPEKLQGSLEHWHRKEKKKATLYDYQIEYSEKAILNYCIEKVSKDKFLWSIELHTGKYHQIRAQLASVESPIIGDVVYGSTAPYKLNAIALQAHKLIFQHPISNKEMIIEAESNL